MANFFRRKSIEQANKITEVERFKLKRELGSLQLLLYVLGATIGAGIFVLPGTTAALHAGPGVVVSFLIGGLVTIAVGLAYVEFAAMAPVAGSAYTYSYIALGEIIAWMIGWDLLLEFIVISSTVAVGWSGYVDSFLQSIGIHLPGALTKDIAHGGVVNLPAVVGWLIVAWIAMSGIKNVGRSNMLFTMAKVGAIVLFLAIGAFHINPINWTPFTPFGWSGVMAGAALVFFAFTGFDGVTTVMEEVKNPQKTIPKALIGGLSVLTLIYALVALVLTGIVPFPELDVPNPTVYALQSVGIQWGGAIIAVSVIFGLLATMIANTTSATRVLFAMSRDGLLPERIAQTNKKTGVPVLSTLIVVGTGILLSGFLSIGELAEFANIGGLTAFALTTVSVVVLRYTRPDQPRIFKVPALWLVATVGVGGCIVLIFSLPLFTIVRFLIWLAIGLVIYIGYGYKHAKMGSENENL
ncbi:amino acid permease [Lysinibacillus sphaericus]|uniref:amino acid permease n=1 Tax=Lysinibacillus sphaericus TaxID=1421 RepID=UPI0018CD7347|nr:amino acid permease [Lysinibacillus sphaericus]MBG9455596.1 amino acid permease [Lysinibacillus sphaericus]MBG9478013.1 amino acid permease [Lysinibacillus sphaericus]MBG9594153.1 amino acid permease [Lysinibacillus sphaericus]